MRGPVDRQKLESFMQRLGAGQLDIHLQLLHLRPRTDLAALLRLGLILREQLRQLFGAIEPELIRYPGIDAAEFKSTIEEFCRD